MQRKLVDFQQNLWIHKGTARVYLNRVHLAPNQSHRLALPSLRRVRQDRLLSNGRAWKSYRNSQGSKTVKQTIREFSRAVFSRKPSFPGLSAALFGFHS